MKKLNSVINPTLIAPFGLKIMRATDVGITIQGEDPEPLTAEELKAPATSWSGTFEVESVDLAKMRSELEAMRQAAFDSVKMRFDNLLLRIDNLVKVHADIEYAGPVLRGYFDGTYLWMDSRSLQRILQVKLNFVHDEMQVDLFGPLAKKVKEGLDA